MAVKTTKTLLEHMNDAWKGKIVYWMNTITGTFQYGKVLYVTKDGVVIVTCKGLPDALKGNWNPDYSVLGMGISELWLGVTEIAYIDN